MSMLKWKGTPGCVLAYSVAFFSRIESYDILVKFFRLRNLFARVDFPMPGRPTGMKKNLLISRIDLDVTRSTTAFN